MNNREDDNRIRLVLLHDHGLFRTSLARLLASEPDLEIVGECGSSSEVLEILNSRQADVIIFDFEFGPESATAFVSEARAAGYQGRFLMIAGRADAEKAAVALKLGASGIVLKSEALARFVQAIRFVANGGVWVDPAIIQLLADQCVNPPARPADHKPGELLQERQEKVLAGILSGLTNKTIGDGMGLSEGTVKNILQGLFFKTGVRTRSQLVRLALEGSLGNFSQIVKRGADMGAGDSGTYGKASDAVSHAETK